MISFKYGKNTVSLEPDKIHVSFELKTITLYFSTQEQTKQVANEVESKLNVSVTNYGKYIVFVPLYNTNIVIK